MNRGTVVFLALAILLAHTLAIHQTPDGAFGAPYEIAHVAYRLGRNLIYEGTAVWNPGGKAVESYPSLSWVLVSAVAARLYISPLLVTQGLGLFSTMASLIVLAQFSTQRTAGLIAPLLVAACGSVAAAGLSGTETPFAMLLVTISYLAYERGWPRTLATSLALLVATRPEGVACTLALIALEALFPPRRELARRLRRSAFALPLAVWGVTVLGRWYFTGFLVSPFAAPLFEFAPERWWLGAHYLWSFVFSSGFGLLLVAIPISFFCGRSSATSARALAFALVWWGLVVLSGGDEQPFWNALVPALPLVFLVIQECLREWMDEFAPTTRVIWPVLVVSVCASFLTSKLPSDIGPLRVEQELVAWQTPSETLARAYRRRLGRLGLLDEISQVENLRSLGVFLRDKIEADASILTFWPGTIGYLSRKEVLDLPGRCWPLPGRERPLSWRGVPRVDVLNSLARHADYLVPSIGPLPENESPSSFLLDWLERYDVQGASEGRMRELLLALNGYELVSVPVPANSKRPNEPSERAFPLLQRKDLNLAPELQLALDRGVLRVDVRHAGHQQLVDLCVRLTDSQGVDWYLRPTGDWTLSEVVDARTSLLLFPTGTRSIRLLQADLPPNAARGRITARLHNPGLRPDAVLAPVGTPVSVEL